MNNVNMLEKYEYIRCNKIFKFNKIMVIVLIKLYKKGLIFWFFLLCDFVKYNLLI